MSTTWQQRFAKKQTTLTDAIRRVQKGQHIFIGSGAAEPGGLVEELVQQKDRLADNNVVHLMTLGPAPYVRPGLEDVFRHNAYFIGANVRQAVHDGRADYTPVFLSQIPGLIRSGRAPIDVALLQVSPPDPFGYVNLGVSVDIALAAIESAEVVVAEVNPTMPVVHGAGFVHCDRISAWVLRESEIFTLPPTQPDDVAHQIGRHVSTLVDDGATLQIGIGQIPDAVLHSLTSRKDLGIWTEVLTDGVIDLMENGNVTGLHKTLENRKVSASFALGQKRSYQYIDRNPAVSFSPSDVINDPVNVARQHKMVAINAALQIDLTGQVCSDSIGTRFYSGIGGQVDFIRGASMARGGKPIIAVRSTAKEGTLSRIVATLDEGAGVVTSRGDVHYVVTEYGIADLHGRSIRERAIALISVAHPDFRSELLDAAKNRHYVFPDQVKPESRTRHDYEAQGVTKDGEAYHLRALRVTDEAKMTDLFYDLSEDTVYKRWMARVPTMHHSQLRDYLETDERDNVAIVVETQPEDREPELVGVGRYHADGATKFADFALVLRDDWQGRGVGTPLLEHMVAIARRNGLKGFTADVLATNRAMLHVFHKAGLKVVSSLDGSTYHVTMQFPEPGSPTS